jgi:hypothetical protein
VYTILIRCGGLLAVVVAALLILSDLVALYFLLFRGSNAGLLFRDTVARYASAPLFLGLTALYVREFKAVGVPGLVGFLGASIGMAMVPLQLVWPAVLTSMGWILFGAASLYAEVYSGAAVMLLISGAGLSGMVNALIASGLLKGNPIFGASAMIIDIIFATAVAWLGVGLFTSRNRDVQRPAQPS